MGGVQSTATAGGPHGQRAVNRRRARRAVQASEDGDVAASSPGPVDPEPVDGHVFARTRQLCELSLQVLPIDGAAITVRGSLTSNELLHATGPVITTLDDKQFVLGEGPCRDAYRDRQPVLEPDTGSDSATARWPGFAREAAAAGAAAVFAFPLQIGAVPFGIL